jgi:hypothetical protein
LPLIKQDNPADVLQNEHTPLKSIAPLPDGPIGHINFGPAWHVTYVASVTRSHC